MSNIILASKSKIRKEILDNHNINSKVEASNVVLYTPNVEIFSENNDLIRTLAQKVRKRIIIKALEKYIDDKNALETEIDPQKQRIELLERNNLDQEKTDMWDD